MVSLHTTILIAYLLISLPSFDFIQYFQIHEPSSVAWALTSHAE